MLRLLHEFKTLLLLKKKKKTIYILNKNSGSSFLGLIRKVSLTENNCCEIWYLSRRELLTNIVGLVLAVYRKDTCLILIDWFLR